MAEWSHFSLAPMLHELMSALGKKINNVEVEGWGKMPCIYGHFTDNSLRSQKQINKISYDIKNVRAIPMSAFSLSFLSLDCDLEVWCFPDCGHEHITCQEHFSDITLQAGRGLHKSPRGCFFSDTQIFQDHWGTVWIPTVRTCPILSWHGPPWTCRIRMRFCHSLGNAKTCLPMQETQVPSLEDPLKEDMATHSSILDWEIPGTKEPGGLLSTGLQRVRHDLLTKQQQGSARDRPRTPSPSTLLMGIKIIVKLLSTSPSSSFYNPLNQKARFFLAP